MLCGIDEAGRGALAGELVVAGCAFKPGFDDELSALVADSKILSEKNASKFIIKFYQNAIIWWCFFK